MGQREDSCVPTVNTEVDSSSARTMVLCLHNSSQEGSTVCPNRPQQARCKSFGPQFVSLKHLPTYKGFLCLCDSLGNNKCFAVIKEAWILSTELWWEQIQKLKRWSVLQGWARPSFDPYPWLDARNDLSSWQVCHCRRPGGIRKGWSSLLVPFT